MGDQGSAYTFAVADVSAADSQRYTNSCCGPIKNLCDLCFPFYDVRTLALHVQQAAGGRETVRLGWFGSRKARLAPEYQFLQNEANAAETLQNLLMYLRTEGTYYPVMKV